MIPLYHFLLQFTNVFAWQILNILSLSSVSYNCHNFIENSSNTGRWFGCFSMLNFLKVYSTAFMSLLMRKTVLSAWFFINTNFYLSEFKITGKLIIFSGENQTTVWQHFPDIATLIYFFSLWLFTSCKYVCHILLQILAMAWYVCMWVTALLILFQTLHPVTLVTTSWPLSSCTTTWSRSVYRSRWRSSSSFRPSSLTGSVVTDVFDHSKSEYNSVKFLHFNSCYIFVARIWTCTMQRQIRQPWLGHLISMRNWDRWVVWWCT